jgi:hypothetical protein
MNESVRTRIVEALATATAGALVLSAVLACDTWSDVRVVHASPEGGELSLLGSRPEAWQKARVEMSRRCGGLDRFEVTEEYDAMLADGGSAATSAADPRIRFVCVVPVLQANSAP